ATHRKLSAAPSKDCVCRRSTFTSSLPTRSWASPCMSLMSTRKASGGGGRRRRRTHDGRRTCASLPRTWPRQVAPTRRTKLVGCCWPWSLDSESIDSLLDTRSQTRSVPASQIISAKRDSRGDLAQQDSYSDSSVGETLRSSEGAVAAAAAL